MKMFNLHKIIILVIIFKSCQGNSKFCGSAYKPSGLIVNGTQSVRGNWPWLAALFNINENEFFCAGTLISNQHVLTAAHCIHEKYSNGTINTNDIAVHLGRYNISKTYENDSQIILLRSIIVHQDWNSESRNYDADIALLFLNEKVTFNSFVFPVCLWEPSIAVNDTIGSIVGWGATHLETPRVPSKIQRQVEVVIIENEKCFLEHYQLTFISSERTFCAKGQDHSGPCLGDSGGGFFFKIGGKWFIRGIISATVLDADGGCDVRTPAIYSNVFLYTDWIIEKTEVSVTLIEDEVEIIKRSDWYASPPGPDILYLSLPSKRIMISHTVTNSCDDLETCKNIMENLQRNHQKKGLNDIYCNFFIGGDGLIFEGRGWEIRGEHTVRSSNESHNDAVCVAFIGNYQDQTPKQSMIDSFFKLLNHGISINMLDKNYIINAQRDFHSSDSPGKAFYRTIKTWPRFSIRASLNQTSFV